MATTTTASELRVKTITPTLTVDDIQESIRFFERLGFGVGERWEDQGTLVGVMMQGGDLEIGLSQDDWKKGRDRQKGVGLRLHLTTTQNIDQIAERARKAGVRLDTEPRDTEWGTRAFDVTEPSGFKITISSHKE